MEWVAGILGLWFLVSVLCQFRPFAGIVASFNRLGLIAKWTFFAPNPGHHDYHVVYRDRRPDGSVTPWQELTGLNCGHNLSCLWNPQRRVVKTVSDAVRLVGVLRAQLAIEPEHVKFTLPYIMLLNFVQAGAIAGGERQFAVVRTHGFAEQRPERPELVLLSDFHAIEAHASAAGTR